MMELWIHDVYFLKEIYDVALWILPYIVLINSI